MHLKLVHEIDKPDLRLPLVNTSKELVGYIDIKNVQAKQKSNQIETHEPEEEVENSDNVLVLIFCWKRHYVADARRM
mgnify:CR=1 FL=1